MWCHSDCCNSWVETVAGLDHFPEQIFKKSLFGAWCCFEALSFANALRRICLEAGTRLMHFPLQTFWEKLVGRLELVGSIFLYESVEKKSFGG